MTVLDPAVTAWHATGRPDPQVTVKGSGVCVRCSATGPCVPVGDVVSLKFSGWDRLVSSGPAVFCVACAWAHRLDGARTQPLLIRNGALTVLTPATLAGVLDHPVGPDTAVTVPVGRRKHLLPAAAWGMVTTDGGSTPWTAVDAALARSVRELKSLGVFMSSIQRQDPPPSSFAKVDGSNIGRALILWWSLGPWRDNPHLLAVGLAAAAGTPL